jgi:ubiquinone/menaquinone biosynthesis C-methylase UbiE
MLSQRRVRMAYKFNQYTLDLHKKLDYDFISGKKLLDVGCGTCIDSLFFKEKYGLDVYSTDVYKHSNVDLFGLNFKEGSIFNLPYEDNSFDHVFLHDIMHHIDEEHQSFEKHVQALLELKRVCKKGGSILIVEGNRYNPLFYPHMVRILGHNHWSQPYFRKVIINVFEGVSFKYFEAHRYPQGFLFLGKIYEWIMENLSPKKFLAYNTAIIEL